MQDVVIGIDEVGRGSWAGPLVVGAVAVFEDWQLSGLTDSKLISKIRRPIMCRLIQQQALEIGLGWVSNLEIDRLGLTQSLKIGAERALRQLKSTRAMIIVDGGHNYLTWTNSRAMVKADQTIPAVSAASVVAKVMRDRYMRRMAEQIPVYGFEQHVGYGTKRHQIALQTYGPCLLHRQSFTPITSN